MNELFNLTGKVIVITGATGSLCSSICHGLADAGATIVAIARNQDKLDSLVHDLAQKGTPALGISADVLDKESLQHAREQISQHFGKIDVLINGAGGNHPDATAMPGERSFFDLPQEALQWVVNLNFMGSVLASQVFGQVMTNQNAGVILNISSMASYQPLTRVVAYSAAKAAVNNFTHWLAVYMALEHHPAIRVNAIAPGFFLGEQNRYLLIDEENGELTQRGQQIIDHTPMARFGEPDELIGATLWLVSDASAFVTGIVVPIDGGFMAYKGV